MPQLSRRTFNEQKRYETVVFQEGTHPADFEMVELQDIQNYERQALTKSLLTDGAISGAFKVGGGTGAGNSVFIAIGPAYIGGLRVEMPDTLHQLVAGQFIYNMAIATPAANRTDLVYLDVFVDNVYYTSDPDIEDVTLGPGAYRERVRYNIAILENAISATPPSLPVGHTAIPLALIVRTASQPLIGVGDVTDARPIASFNPQFKAQNLIVVSPVGGDFSDPSLALASLAGVATATNPYTILVRPGIYTVATNLVFNAPYVSMIGTDPDACVIKCVAPTGGAAMIEADHIVLRNLTIDYAPGGSGHAAVVYFTGAFAATLDNLVLGAYAYAENSTNAFNGIDASLAGVVKVRRCSIYSQNYATIAAVAVGASCTLDMADCSVTAATTPAFSVSNAGTAILNKCSFIGTQVLVSAAGNITARNCSWKNQVIKAFAVAGTPVITLTSGANTTLIDCAIDGLGAGGSMTGALASWKDVVLNVQFSTSGGTSTYENCSFQAGIDVNGNAAKFVGCAIDGAYQGWAVGGSSGESLIIRGTCSPVIIDCIFSSGKCVAVIGGNPIFTGCSFSSSLASARVINVLSLSSTIVVSDCLFQLFASYSGTAPISIGATGDTFVMSQCHLQGSALGQPAYFIDGLTGAALFAGANTGSAAFLYNHASGIAFTSNALNL